MRAYHGGPGSNDQLGDGTATSSLTSGAARLLGDETTATTRPLRGPGDPGDPGLLEAFQGGSGGS